LIATLSIGSAFASDIPKKPFHLNKKGTRAVALSAEVCGGNGDHRDLSEVTMRLFAGVRKED